MSPLVKSHTVHFEIERSLNNDNGRNLLVVMGKVNLFAEKKIDTCYIYKKGRKALFGIIAVIDHSHMRQNESIRSTIFLSI